MSDDFYFRLREAFVESIKASLNEEITYEPISGLYKINPPAMKYKSYSDCEWVYSEQNPKLLNIVKEILKPVDNENLNLIDKRYVVQCENNKLFYVSDAYLKSLDFLRFNNVGKFIPLTFEECQSLKSSFYKKDRHQYPIYVDPEVDLKFKEAKFIKIKSPD